MAYRPQFNTKRRDYIFSREKLKAYNAGLGENPICVHCNLPVLPIEEWDESHIGAPAALGGRVVGVGHRACNQLDNNKVVTPMVARAKSMAAHHEGRKGPGLGRYPMRAGRRSAISKTFKGRVVARLTLGEKLAALRARRFFVVETPEGPDAHA